MANYISRFQCPYEPTDSDFIGVNLLTADRVGKIAFDKESPRITESRRSPEKLEQIHKVCEKTSEYITVQEWGIEANGSKDSLKVNAGFQLLMEQSYKSDSLMCVSRGFIIVGKDEYLGGGVKLSDYAKSVLTNGGPEQFIKEFGTHFIGGYVVGSLFDSYIEYTAITQGSKMEMSAALAGAYESAGKKAGEGGGSLDFSSKESELSKISRKEGRLVATGFAEEMNISSVADVMREFSKFSLTAQKSPARITCICVPYTEIEEVNAILRDSHGSAPFVPNLPSDVVSAICREARECTRANAAIEEYGDIARGRGPSLTQISDNYSNQLMQHLDSFQSLSLSQLDGMNTTGIQKADAIYEKWKDEFRSAYNHII